MSEHSPRELWSQRLRRDLAARREQHLYRALKQIDSPQGPTLTMDGRTYVQFCTNNYLGLATDPEVIDAAREATAKWGTGAGASRLVAGSMAIHHELETVLAEWKHCDRALLFPSGFMANLGVLTTFAGESDRIVSDKLNHASLLDAAKFSGAMCRTFPHRKYERAAALLEESDGLQFLVTDSVFSMDGDVADLPAVCDVAEARGALVMVDDAHGTGVLGATGAGLAEAQGVTERIAIQVGTLSKALGSVGGFVCGSGEAIETLVNAARSFIYTTALPPACSAAALAAVRIVQREPARRERVMLLAGRVKAALVGMGWDCGDSASPIVPVMMGTAEAALAGAEFLRERGIYVAAIRPSTVPPNGSRLRLSLMATHSDAQVAQLIDAMGLLRRGASG